MWIGAFGYFPSYTLGAMYAAQIFSAAERAIPQLRDNIRKGSFMGQNANFTVMSVHMFQVNSLQYVNGYDVRSMQEDHCTMLMNC